MNALSLPDGKLLYYEDYGVKGLQSISTEGTAWPGEGTIVLPSVRQAKWAVAEKGIYYVKFDDRSVPYGVDQRLFAPSSVHPIMFYDFRTRKEAQIGAIGREVGSFSSHFGRPYDRVVAGRQCRRQIS